MHKTPRFKTCVLAVTMAALPWFANAAGLGRLNVLSGLGQPFRGEIDLVSVQPSESDSLVVSLAPPEAYSNAQIAYPSGSLGLRFNIEKRAGGQYYVVVSSSQAISEPYLDLLVELNWAAGRIQREYTALIDPAGYTPGGSTSGSAKFAPSVLPGVKTSGAIKPAKTSKAAKSTSTTESAAAAKPQTTEAAADSGVDSYKTKSGDTLSGVAKSVQPAGVSLEQVLVGLYRSNPEAFDGNMNRLKRGKILHVPSAGDLQQLSQKEAAKEIKVQSANWNEYRSKLGDVTAKAPARDLSEQTAAGKITTKVEDQGANAVDKNKDVLKLSKAADAAKKSGDVGKIQALEEEVAARQKALNDANQRVAELQKNVSDMEKFAAMKAKAGANVASAVATPVASAVAEASAVVAEAASSAEVVASAPVAEVASAAPVVKPKKRVEVVVPDAPVESGFIEGLFENPLALGGGVLAILLGAGGLWYARRRQRPAVFEDSIITGGDLKANTVLGSTGGGVISTQSTENSFLTDFSRQGLGTIDTDEVDPIAEAEVYMAYGRDAQAEEILKDALHKDPSRHEIRMKLLDIYAARKDKVSFEEHASALFAITGGKGANWDSAAQSGRSIDSENPLYQQQEAESVATPVVAAVVAATAGAAVYATDAVMGDVTEPDFSQVGESDLDFELDLDHATSFVEPVAELQVEEAPLAVPSLDAQPLDFGADLSSDLSFDLDEATHVDLSVATLEAPQADHMMSLDLPIDLGASTSAMDDLADLDALADFDLDAALNPVAEVSLAPELASFDAMADSLDLDIATHEVDANDVDESNFADLNLPDLSATTTEIKETAKEELIEVADELGLDFDFDLNAVDEMDAPIQATSASAEMDVALDDISLNLDEAATGSTLDFAADDPVQTKIDLARAYIDMGDVEGAREILQEAQQEGNSDQQALAHSLLADL